MTTENEAARLARTWITCWNQGRPLDIPLAEDFTHTSPLGVIAGRKTYLDKIIPMSAKNVVDLRIRAILSSEGQAAIWFEMETENGVVQVCDWLQTENGEIKAINAFYDTYHLPHRETY